MRAQLKHCLIDVDFFNNPKIRALKSKFGQLSQLCLIDIYTAMSQATNAVIDEDCILAIISEYKLTDEFLAYCLDRRLIQPEMNGFSNSRVIADQESLFKQQEKWRKAKSKQAEFPKPSPKIPIGILREGARLSEHLNTEDLKIEDLNNKKEVASSPVPEIKLESKYSYLIPDALDQPDNSNQSINMGRRRLKKYPEIYLTPYEFCDVLEQYEQDGIPIDERKIYQNAFKIVNSEILTNRAKGKTTDFTNAYKWLIGFAKTDLLKQYKESLAVKRNEKYNREAQA